MGDQNEKRNIPGFSVFYRSGEMDAGGCHCHEHHQVIFFLSGEGTCQVEGKTYRLCPGDVLLTSDRELHQDGEASEKNQEGYIAYIDSSFFEEARRLDMNGEDLSRCFSGLSGEQSHLLRLGEAEQKRVETILRTLSQVESPQAYGSDMLKKCYMVELLIHLNRACFSESHREEGEYNRKLQRVVEFINENLRQELTLDLLSLRFGVSKYHLTREFKRCLGLSLHQYILKKRLLLARSMLRQGETVAWAFSQSGFSDYSHFSRAFRESFGMSPREYRSRAREGPFPFREIFW